MLRYHRTKHGASAMDFFQKSRRRTCRQFFLFRLVSVAKIKLYLIMLQRMMRCISAISCNALNFPDISIVLLGRKLKLQAMRKRLRLCQNVFCGVGTLKHIISIGPLGTDYVVPNYDRILHVDYYDIFQRSRSPLEGAILRGKAANRC